MSEEIDKAGAFQKGKELLTKSIKSVQEGDLETLKSLFSTNTKEMLNEISEGKGRTVTHFAAIFGKLDVLDWAFESGADPDLKDDDGNSINALAVYHEHQHVLEYMVLKFPHTLEARNNKKMSLLHIATETSNIQIVEYLLEKKLDVNETSENGTPLELAVMWKKLDMARLLLAKGADPNGSRGSFIPPPLVMAASMNNKEAVDLLLQHGADPNLSGSDKVTALEVACEFAFDFIDALIEKGAKVTGRVLKAAYNNKKYEILDRFLTVIDVEKCENNAQATPESEEFKAQGNEEYYHKNFIRAVELYTKAIECCPLSIYYSNRSQAYIFLSQFDKALEDARKSRGIDPKNAKALLREAQALSQIDKQIEAAGCYWYALKLEKNPNVSAVFLSTLDSF